MKKHTYNIFGLFVIYLAGVVQAESVCLKGALTDDATNGVHLRSATVADGVSCKSGFDRFLIPPAAEGDKGEVGDKGQLGNPGPKGTPGETGDKGIAGEQGSQGDKGNTGSEGLQGIKGDTGAVGQRGNPTITLSTTVTFGATETPLYISLSDNTRSTTESAVALPLPVFNDTYSLDCTLRVQSFSPSTLSSRMFTLIVDGQASVLSCTLDGVATGCTAGGLVSVTTTSTGSVRMAFTGGTEVTPLTYGLTLFCN
jgi:hypothetical protein